MEDKEEKQVNSAVRPQMLDVSTFLKKFSLDDGLDKVEELIDGGNSITSYASLGLTSDILATDPQYYYEVQDHYAEWKMQCRNFFKNKGEDFKYEYGIFSESDAVPYAHYVERFDEKRCSEGDQMLRDVLYEVKTKLTVLREVKKKLTNVRGSSNFNFSLNLHTGELCRYPKEMFEPLLFVVTGGRFKIIKILIEEKKKGNHYVPTKEITDSARYGSLATCRKEIGSIRATIASSFQMGGKEFIDSIIGKGYKIGDKINVSFIRTP